jgi:hypothetical protein
MINQESIKALNPCKDRFDNYIKHYGTRSFTPAQFLGLKNITHKDKLWVAFRILPKETVVKIAADSAESVLHIYEAKYPGDLRPRKAIEASRSGANLLEARNAAASADAAAYHAANAAYAAASYAYAAASDASAAYAAAFDAYHAASAAYAAASDASAAYAAAEGKGKQEKLIRTIILKYWNKESK